jgi:hypothetical protein
MILADSLVNGFLGSNLMGQGIVAAQLLGSVIMFAVVIGKWKETFSDDYIPAAFLFTG